MGRPKGSKNKRKPQTIIGLGLNLGIDLLASTGALSVRKSRRSGRITNGFGAKPGKKKR